MAGPGAVRTTRTYYMPPPQTIPAKPIAKDKPRNPPAEEDRWKDFKDFPKEK